MSLRGSPNRIGCNWWGELARMTTRDKRPEGRVQWSEVTVGIDSNHFRPLLFGCLWHLAYSL
jgi:hypothetical protein